MSDPVSSVDVEDVLSSIRRLVSEEAKAAAPATSDGEKSESVKATGESRLANFSKSSASFSANGGGSEAVPPSNEFNRVEKSGDRQAIDQIVRQFTERGAADQPSEAKPAANAPDPSQTDNKLLLTEALRVGQSSQAPRSAQKERLHLRPVPGEASDKSAPVETDEAPKRAYNFDVAPDDLLFDRANRAMEQAQSGKSEVEDEDSLTTLDDADLNWRMPPAPKADAGAKEAVAPKPQVAASADLNPGSLHRESPASPFHGEKGAIFSNPQKPEAAKATPEDVLDESDATAEAEMEAARPAEDSEPASTISFAEQDDSILDDDTLRDLVAQMVREELQGELGDRITRNVRKLVRREIQRALASREFE